MNNVASIVVTLVLAAGGALFAYYTYRNRLHEEGQHEQRSGSRRRRATPAADLIDCTTCSICKEDFRREDTVLLQCGHLFHTFCIREWFTVRFNCPTCRFEIPDTMINNYKRQMNIH